MKSLQKKEGQINSGPSLALAPFILDSTLALEYKQLLLKGEFEFQIISTVFGPASMPRHPYELQM